MPKLVKNPTLYDTLEGRLRWALESSLTHFLKVPDRNAIDDWARDLAEDIAGAVESKGKFTRTPKAPLEQARMV